MKLPDQKGFYVYILECMDHTYYTGWTTDLNKRFSAHTSGKGARYTKAHPPLSCVYYECFQDQTSAMKREYEIKQMTRLKKQQLIATMMKKI